jgi:hypothetical protein
MGKLQAIRYIVKREFLYGDRRYKPGDEFEPEGNRLDARLIQTHCRMERILPEPKATKEAKHAA